MSSPSESDKQATSEENLQVFLQKGDNSSGIKAWNCSGRYLPPQVTNPASRLDLIRDIKYREGDIFICGYPKCGNNWMHEMVSRLLASDPDRVCDYLPLVCMTSTPERVIDAPSPRIILSHLPYEYVPKEHRERQGKIIFLVRNIKDVMVSYYEFVRRMRAIKSPTPWPDYVEFFMKGEMIYNSYTEYLRNFDDVMKQKPGQIIMVSYEDMVKDCLSEMRRVRSYLELDRSDELLEKVVENCSFSNMRAAKLAHPVYKKDITPEGDLILFRKGRVGDWKNWFTVAQNEKLDAFIEKELSGTSYKFTYTLPEQT